MGTYNLVYLCTQDLPISKIATWVSTYLTCIHTSTVIALHTYKNISVGCAQLIHVHMNVCMKVTM